jgi:hypothetical protein
MIRIITLALACALGQAVLQDATGSCAKWCLAGQQLVVDPDTGRCASTCTACPAGTFKARNGYHGCSVQRTTCDATQRKVFGGSLISDIRCESCPVSPRARRVRASPSSARARARCGSPLQRRVGA